MSKTYDYVIELKKQSFKLIDFISQFMMLLCIGAFLFEAYQTLVFDNTYLNKRSSILLIIISVLILAWWIYVYRMQKMATTPYYRLGLLIGALGWWLIPSGLWIGLIYLVAGILEKPVKVQSEIGFDEEEIAFNSFPTKKIDWQAINNVVLKDGLLTIDLKNNTIIQKEVNDSITKETEKEFNAFCLSQVKKEERLN